MTKIEPQPPHDSIKYMLGNESWLPISRRSRRRLLCEEWGNLGPAELDSTIEPNSAGFRVRLKEFLAPTATSTYVCEGGVYFWAERKEKVGR